MYSEKWFDIQPSHQEEAGPGLGSFSVYQLIVLPEDLAAFNQRHCENVMFQSLLRLTMQPYFLKFNELFLRLPLTQPQT